MKNKLFKPTFVVIASVALILVACDNNMMPSEQENIGASNSMDLAIGNMFTYHDSTLKAKMHSSLHLHHYDSIYHHYDSTYQHHHNKYHHTDTLHHHSGYHHELLQHHKHDSINEVHHILIH
jgi:hypothetical protein